MINDTQMNLMVSLKIPQIIMEIVQKTDVPSDEAFDMFYNSQTYMLLSDKKTYYWGESAQFVAESLMREYSGLSIEEFKNI